MGESPIKLFVIVVTYKGKQWYDRCFTSLRNTTTPVQTIAVDNASNDGTVEYIKENYPEIILIESKENLGFGKGNNLALKYAYEHGCDYVFLLNQDTWIEDFGMFEKLIALSMRYPEYGIVSPIHLSADKKSFNMALEHLDNSCSLNMLSDLYCGVLKDIYETNYINAAGWLLPRHTLSVLGGFDLLIFLYGEDDDYLNRARFHGLKIGVCPGSTMIHDHKHNLNFEISRQLMRKASLEKLNEYLNLNQPFDYQKLRWHFFKKYVKAILIGNRKLRKWSKYKLKYLKRMRHAIENSRIHNAVKQPNWIQ